MLHALKHQVIDRDWEALGFVAYRTAMLVSEFIDTAKMKLKGRRTLLT